MKILVELDWNSTLAMLNLMLGCLPSVKDFKIIEDYKKSKK